MDRSTESKAMKQRRTLILAALSVLLTVLFAQAQAQGIRVTRLDISSPWNGFYYGGQGAQIWGKAVVHNSSQTSLRQAKIRFEFFDSVGTRETFEKPLPVIQPGGVAVIESPQWLDYSGAQLGLAATVIYNNRDIAEKRMELSK